MAIFKGFRLRKKALIILLGVSALLVLIIWISMRSAGNKREIKKVTISISPEKGVYFLTHQDVTNLVNETTGNPVGKSLGILDLGNIETVLRKQRCVASAQVFTSMNGTLTIQVQQRVPVLRVLNSWGDVYYLDSGGIKIPETGMRTPDILTASGYIGERFRDSARAYSRLLNHLLKTARFIHADSFWNALFEQCYVDNSGDIILVPRLGKHSIVTGTSDNLREKMRNLRVFYEKALPATGWEVYSGINLKYTGQVVGVRSGLHSEQKVTPIVQKETH